MRGAFQQGSLLHSIHYTQLLLLSLVVVVLNLLSDSARKSEDIYASFNIVIVAFVVAVVGKLIGAVFIITEESYDEVTRCKFT